MNPHDQQTIERTFERALALHRAGHLSQAIAAYRKLLIVLPNSREIRVNLAVALKDTGQVSEAISYFNEAIEIDPNCARTWNNLAIAAKSIGDFDQALAAFEKAIQLDPNSAIMWNNLGLTHQDAGQLDDAIRCYDRAISLDPQLQIAQSNRLYALHFRESITARSLYDEHRRWGDLLSQKSEPFTNNRSLDRRLKIGYVSADLRDHVVGRFMHPLLVAHDRAQFEIHCYNTRPASGLPLAIDNIGWHDIATMSDEQAAQLIRESEIDILVDLSMQMAYNRLSLFAKKPAPVQVTYLAYCSTTGLDAIDYRITDPFLDPPGQTERIYTETAVYLPQTYWCYAPPVATPEPAPRSIDQITFGCLNNFSKVRPTTLKTWCEILRAVPGSRLILHAHAGKNRDRVFDLLKNEQVDPSRLEFVGFQRLEKYFEQYRRIDIALDTFPYAGGTTTCDALWMGVPVVTLAGQTAVGRGGVSILSNIGLHELIARSLADYVGKAVELAGDLPRLAELRSTLRQKMKSSPLMDAVRFTANMEMIYRQIWKNWIASQR